jgi:hypothetical protein
MPCIGMCYEMFTPLVVFMGFVIHKAYPSKAIALYGTRKTHLGRVTHNFSLVKAPWSSHPIPMCTHGLPTFDLDTCPILVETSIIKHAWVNTHPNSSKNDLSTKHYPTSNHSMISCNQNIGFQILWLDFIPLHPNVVFAFRNG